jgi:hypothetical protein
LRCEQRLAALDHERETTRIPDGQLVKHLRERWLPKAREAVDTAAWDTAWKRGATLERDRALELAIKA